MKRLEVRCCCVPKKLLGTLPVPDHLLQAPQLTMLLMQPRFFGLPTDRRERRPTSINLQITEIQDGRERWRAIKAEGVPIETLRLIPGFIEATGD